MKSIYAIVVAVCLAFALHYSYQHFTSDVAPKTILPQTESHNPTISPETLSSESTPSIAPIDSSEQVVQPEQTIDDLIRKTGSNLMTS